MSHDRTCWKCGADTLAEEAVCAAERGYRCVKNSLFRKMRERDMLTVMSEDIVIPTKEEGKPVDASASIVRVRDRLQAEISNRLHAKSELLRQADVLQFEINGLQTALDHMKKEGMT